MTLQAKVCKLKTIAVNAYNWLSAVLEDIVEYEYGDRENESKKEDKRAGTP